MRVEVGKIFLRRILGNLPTHGIKGAFRFAVTHGADPGSATPPEIDFTGVFPGQDINFCSDLPSSASEIQLSLALLQLLPALERIYVL